MITFARNALAAILFMLAVKIDNEMLFFGLTPYKHDTLLGWFVDKYERLGWRLWFCVIGPAIKLAPRGNLKERIIDYAALNIGG